MVSFLQYNLLGMHSYQEFWQIRWKLLTIIFWNSSNEKTEYTQTSTTYTYGGRSLINEILSLFYFPVTTISMTDVLNIIHFLNLSAYSTNADTKLSRHLFCRDLLFLFIISRIKALISSWVTSWVTSWVPSWVPS